MNLWTAFAAGFLAFPILASCVGCAVWRYDRAKARRIRRTP